MEKERVYIGGQAVIEGVMMRGPEKIATAVRTPDGKITIQCDFVHSLAQRFPILQKRFLRGSIALGEAVVYGMKSLSFAARVVGEEEEEEESSLGMIGVIGCSIIAAIVFFLLIPTYVAHLLLGSGTSPVALNIVEGFLRLVVFLIYIRGISYTAGMQRVFEYHGAEHKTIWTYEAGEALTVENVQKHSRLHPRCGTSFLLIVMIISIFVFAFLGWPNLVIRVLSRILLMPLVAGISYEIIRYAIDTSQGWVKILTKPGLWLQHETTREPHPDQIEVAIAALQAVRPSE